MNNLRLHTFVFSLLVVAAALLVVIQVNYTGDDILGKSALAIGTSIDVVAVVVHGFIIMGNVARSNREYHDIELNDTNIIDTRQEKIIESFNHIPINSLKQLEKTLCFDSFPKEIQDIERLDIYSQEKIKDIYEILSIFYKSDKFRPLVRMDFSKEYPSIAEAFVDSICNRILVDVFHLEVNVDKIIEKNFSNHQEKIMSLFCQDAIHYLSTLPKDQWSSLNREDLTKIYDQSLSKYTTGFLKKLTDTQEASDMSNNIDIINVSVNTSKNSVNSLGESGNNKTITNTDKQKQIEHSRISI